MARILLFSDLHLHPHNSDWRRVDDGMEVLKWIHKEAVERKIDKVWFLGDWFHVRGYLYPSVVARTYEAMMWFKNSGIEVATLVGNHDMPHKQTTLHHSLTAFGSIVQVIDQPMIYETDTWNFYWLPYVESVGKTKWAIDKIVAQKDPNKKSCLLAHLDINGANYSTFVESTHGIDADYVDSAFDMVITGHYHARQIVGDHTFYIGSPYQQNFGETNETKGFMIFDNGELDFVENTFSPKYMYINESQIDERVANNYITVRVASADRIIHAREKSAQFNPRNVTIKIERTEMGDAPLDMQTNQRDVTTLMREWVAKTANPKIYNIDKLMEHGIAIVKESGAEV